MIFLAETAHAAESAGGIGGLFEALGLDGRSLILNTLAFLIVVWILGKFVYPHLIRALDAKKDELETAVRLEREARVAHEQAEAKALDLVKQARESADVVIAAAHAEANETLEVARKKAEAQTQASVSQAREQLERDVAAARADLKRDMAKLVASATGRILDEKLDNSKDAALIERSLEAK